MTPNQMLLARLQANQLIRKSQREALQSPPQQVMAALKAAIEERSACMAKLVATGRGNSAEYQQAAQQFREWDAVWRSNR